MEVTHSLDQKDRQLVALLKQDSRASITVLAAKMGVSRATAQTRLDRLVSSGVISRFTIDLAANTDNQQIRAIIMLELDGAQENRVTRQMNNLPEVERVYSTNGKWDLIAVIETQTLAQFDAILREIRHIRGVRNSETSILLNTV